MKTNIRGMYATIVANGGDLLLIFQRCACDVPSHNYTWSFEPKTDFSSVYPKAKEIFQYFDDFSRKYGLRKFCKTRHQVTGAYWEGKRGQWRLDVKNLETGRVKEDFCHILVNASGVLNKWKWPDIPGLHEFRGKLLHTAHWDSSVDLKDKNVGLIGNGASGIQILPAIQPYVRQLTTFIRHPTWVSPVQGLEQHIYRPEELTEFQLKPEALLQYRQMIERGLNGQFDIFLHDTQVQKDTHAHMVNAMKEKLHDTKLEDTLIPSWDVGCRRLTPGVNYLETLGAPNVAVVNGGIDRVSASGIHCSDSATHNPDILICATGFDVSLVPRFPIVNHEGHNLQDLWSAPNTPSSYVGVAAPSFPNYLSFLGPNSPVGNGPVLYAVEAQADYMLHWLDRYQTENIHRFSPKPSAVEESTAWKNAYMRRTVWGQPCKSWYKRNTVDGEVTALWPGSALHYIETLHDLERRGDDWDVVYEGNRWDWLGNGYSQTEKDLGADWGYYIREWDDRPLASRGMRRKIRTGSGLFVKGGLGDKKPGTA